MRVREVVDRDEMVAAYLLNGVEFEQTQRVGHIRKPGLLHPWGRKELDTTLTTEQQQ